MTLVVFLSLIINTVILFTNVCGSEYVTVTTNEGTLRGSTALDRKSRSYYSFKGIPFGKSTDGELKFKPPQPVEPWSGIRDALEFGPDCIQPVSTEIVKIVGSHDCLYLNVYTPKLPNKSCETLPVMFWIYGGSFNRGSGSDDSFGPQYLVSEDVIVVTANYRLGVYGFLKLEDETLNIPGNAGAKDVILALQWVQRNIEYFGGNPQDVTLFGESSGAKLSHSLMQAPITKGLFHKVIAQSGSIYSYWSYLYNSSAIELVKQMGHELHTEQEALEILKIADPKDVIVARNKYDIATKRKNIRTFGLTVNNKDESLFKNPVQILKEGKVINDVPLMAGFNVAEGILRTGPRDDIDSWMPRTNEDFQRVLPTNMNLELGSEKAQEVAEKVKQFYFGNDTEKNDLVYDFIDLYSDLMYINGVYTAMIDHSAVAKSPVYFYRFAYDTKINYLKLRRHKTDLKGAAHCDDVGYMWYFRGRPDVEPGSVEDEAIDRITKVWTTFAKTGNPNPEDNYLTVEWLPFKPNETNYINFDKNIMVATEFPEKKRLEFWKKLYESL